MSVTISLKNTMARSSDAALNLIQLSLLIAGFLLFFGMAHVVVKDRQSSPFSQSNELKDNSVPLLASELPEALPEVVEVPPPAAPAPILSPRMQSALDYVKRRYRVSPEALVPVFEIAQMIGKERSIDPLLIVAIIGIESGFNPFAESAMGAQGLMQIIPRFHQDKLPDSAGERPLLDPLINIRVGVRVLEEAIHRRGGLIPGLQYYAGSSDSEASYASKVLAEKARLEQAATRRSAAAVPAA